MGSTEYEVLDRWGIRNAVADGVAARAAAVAAMAAGGSPRRSGALAGGWTVTPGRFPAVFIVTNDVPWGMYHEYGTKSVRASAMLGRAIASNR